MHILTATLFTALLITALALLAAMIRRDGAVMLNALLGRQLVAHNASSMPLDRVVLLHRRPFALAGVRPLRQQELRAAA